ncbi:nuclear transport factor 2 family protein [Oculatella sp. LEGE 06141]|uniref:nuclear transport factor 2 family protein n=1 Tax=Oculatella sp. LEGE 06141 TaxID=1828648 RepID=UPI00187E04CE|nr:nuclear transport factor 2 family protein [Oculatella sp. LEGE 06141]MBE9178771.1 nuclear transport factor 2 family protein [Oculatella sp. LEGE 06141]
MHNPQPTRSVNVQDSSKFLTQTSNGVCQSALCKASASVSSLFLGLLISFGGSAIAQTETPPAAPPALTTALSQMDTAASEGDLDAVMEFFSPNLTHSDGLNYQNLRNALAGFWERYPDLTYRTTLNSWQQDGAAIVAETTTTITGTRTNDGRRLNLNASITSRQRFENGEIVRQDILSERSEVTTGVRPPTVEVSLPEQVTTGESFNFDAIVAEPLGERLLLGAAIEEPIRPRGYLRAAPINLEILSAGGLFKVGQAPAQPNSQWISAVVVRNDGITLVTERLQVNRPSSSTETQSPSQ